MAEPPQLIFGSIKTFTHSVGLSCCFRQWRAKSHCRFLHGYALQFKFTFEGDLDENGWVQDFGGLDGLREHLKDVFDHTTLIAGDDPSLEYFQVMHERRLIQLRIMQAVGVEAFALWAFNYYTTAHTDSRVKLMQVEVSEHDGNSAYVRRA